MIRPLFTGIHGNFEYKTKYAIGADLCSQDYYELLPGCTQVISTKVYLIGKIQDEDKLLNISVCPRSSLSAKGILCHHGTIDIDYRDEIKVVLTNSSNETYLINWGDRIAQLVCNLNSRFATLPVANVERTGGFGSTGV